MIVGGAGGGVYSVKTVLTCFPLSEKRRRLFFGGQVRHKVHCPFQAIIRAVKITPITFRTDFFGVFFFKSKVLEGQEGDERKNKVWRSCSHKGLIKDFFLFWRRGPLSHLDPLRFVPKHMICSQSI